jgi:hypothetical protein
MDIPVGNQKEEFWQQHIAQMLKFKGSQREYAEHHGITLSKLAYYRDKYRKKSSFAKVVASESTPAPKRVVENQTYPRAGLPDAKWLADLIRELFR